MIPVLVGSETRNEMPRGCLLIKLGGMRVSRSGSMTDVVVMALHVRAGNITDPIVLG